MYILLNYLAIYLLGYLLLCYKLLESKGFFVLKMSNRCKSKANNTVNKAIKNHFPCSSHSTKIRKMNGLLDKCYGENEAEEMTWDYCEVTVKIGLT